VTPPAADVPVEAPEADAGFPHNQGEAGERSESQTTPAFLGAARFRISNGSEDLAVNECECRAGEDEAQQHHIAFDACLTDPGSQEVRDPESDYGRQPESG